MKSLLYSLLLFLIFPFNIQSQAHSKYIVVDQFGYRPISEKIAVLRDPITGYDASESFVPGNSYALVNVANGAQVFTGNSVQFNSGIEDATSGDRVWWFDFSSYQTPGTYYILDIDKNVKSYEFKINDNVYDDVLKHAVRTFFYQRAGYAKEAQYAGENWADGASHLGPLQDSQCRKFDAATNASTEKDLSGGWYDAGDYNKYTPWTSNYIIDMISAYREYPSIWKDDYNLPYSGNGTPDLIDELKWGLDYLLKLQESDGSLISVVDLSHATPPSSANDISLYGGINTTSTLTACAAYAYGAKIFNELGNTAYANTLQQSAIAAWNWATANPRVIWENNSAAYNSVGIGSGQQETDDYGRFAYKMRAAIYLFDLTGDTTYRSYIDTNVNDIHLMLWAYAYPFEQEYQEVLMYYASLPNATSSVASNIKNTYNAAMNSIDNFNALNDEVDPYLAHLRDYVWGSNQTKSKKGLMFIDYIRYGINPANNDDAFRAAERYIHYIHGLNPLNLCYLSNMYDYGGDNCVNEFYHTWFWDGSDWDHAQYSRYGPAPGFLTGGANPTYNWEDCCPSGCGGAACDVVQRDRIANQPKQKAYDDFNTNWPMNSWEISENSNGYQLAYIKLLSKFVGLETVLSTNKYNTSTFSYHPNPFNTEIQLSANGKPFNYEVYTVTGQKITTGTCKTNCAIGKNIDVKGVYFVKIATENESKTIKIIKN